MSTSVQAYQNSEKYLYLFSALYAKVIKVIHRKSNHPSKILVIKYDEIGDMATAIPAMLALKKSNPNAKIDILIKPFLFQFVKEMGIFNQIYHSMPADKYQTIINLRSNWKQFWQCIWQFPNHYYDRGTVRIYNKANGGQKHETITNFEIIKPINSNNFEIDYHIPISNQINNEVKQFLDVNQIEKYAVFHIGARKKLRQWPLEKFKAIAMYLNSKYQFKIIWAGSKDDESDILKIQSMLDFRTFATPYNFDLMHFVSLCKSSKIFIGNESGPLHLACAINAKVIGLYGPGVKDVFYPWSKYHVVFHHILSCNPCDQVNCKFPENPCINRIEISEVKLGIDQLLKKD